MDTSGVYLEVLKLEEDIPAGDGELGRLVITDLYNYAFPPIRYENGDIVVRKSVKRVVGSSVKSWVRMQKFILSM